MRRHRLAECRKHCPNHYCSVTEIGYCKMARFFPQIIPKTDKSIWTVKANLLSWTSRDWGRRHLVGRGEHQFLQRLLDEGSNRLGYVHTGRLRNRVWPLKWNGSILSRLRSTKAGLLMIEECDLRWNKVQHFSQWWNTVYVQKNWRVL